MGMARGAKNGRGSGGHPGRSGRGSSQRQPTSRRASRDRPTHHVTASDAPPCAICARAGSALRTVRHLTHGVSVWLCETHGNDRYVRAQGGAVFAQRLARMWLASGNLTARRDAALRAHVRQVTEAGVDSDLPGSYSWPKLRQEAEERFARGDDPTTVITELRERHRDCPAMAPSVRTMRRWYSQARWMPPAPCRATRTRPHMIAGRYVPTKFELVPFAMIEYVVREIGKHRRRGP